MTFFLLSWMKKKYFQCVANDTYQLNNCVIRGFKKEYLLDESPKLEIILQGEVEFYAHCILSLGIRLNLWEK